MQELTEPSTSVFVWFWLAFCNGGRPPPRPSSRSHQLYRRRQAASALAECLLRPRGCTRAKQVVGGILVAKVKTWAKEEDGPVWAAFRTPHLQP